MGTFDHKVTIVVTAPAENAYPVEDFRQTVASALAIDYAKKEVIVVDWQPNCPAVDLGDLSKKVKRVAGDFPTRSARLNAGWKAAKGEFVLLVPAETAPFTFRQGSLGTYVYAATRGKKAAGLIYSDYDRIGEDGSVKEVHLLEWHPGRLRDLSDFGPVFFCSRKALKGVGGLDESLKAGEMYDLRLKISEKFPVKHISNRMRGSLYSIKQRGAGHDVFAYLLAAKEVQLEMERICTEHLKRIGAYLAPGAHYLKVEYTPEEEARFKDCIATVIVPVFGRPEFMAPAIESIWSQTVKNIEAIIVVNGGESDPTVKEVKRYQPGGDKYQADKPPIRLIVTDVNNIGLCLNMGCEQARGKYYVQLDSDDQLTSDCVEKILKVYEEDARIGMVVGSYAVWQKQADGSLVRREDIPVVTHDEWTEENGRNNLLRINGAGAPRSFHIKVLKEVGWFGVNDTPYSRNYGEDYDLVHRIIERYRMGRVWDPIYKVVRHSGGTDHSIDQVTIDRNDEAKDHMRLEALHRRMAMNKKAR